MQQQNLKILVLAKQVPDTRNVGKDAMTPEGTVNRAALPAIFNPEDLNALEAALRLKDRVAGSTVHILTMGPQRAADIIRDAMFRGADGGYLFSGDPRQISLQQVAQALEARCVSSAWRSGDTDMDCLIASGMAAVMDELFADLDSRCMERLGEIALSDLEARLFSAGTRPCGKKREAGRRE